MAYRASERPLTRSALASNRDMGLQTVFRVFLHNLHDTDDTRVLAVGVIEEGFVADIHASQVVAG